jgi:hypothetical protein
VTNFKRVTEDTNMSEEIKTETKTEVKPEVVDLVADNVAILKSKIFGLEALVEELTEKLDVATTKYGQAKEFMDNDAKADLLTYIAPRYNMSKELLVLKTVDELKAIKAVMDKVETPVFKSGTPMSDSKKPNQEALLASTFERAQAKRRGGN